MICVFVLFVEVMGVEDVWVLCQEYIVKFVDILQLFFVYYGKLLKDCGKFLCVILENVCGQLVGLLVIIINCNFDYIGQFLIKGCSEGFWGLGDFDLNSLRQCKIKCDWDDCLFFIVEDVQVIFCYFVWYGFQSMGRW